MKDRRPGPLDFSHFTFRAVHRPFTLFSFFLLSAAPCLPLTFPDTASLKKEYRVQARKDGRPALLSRVKDGDSVSMALEWEGGKPVSARIEQGDEFEPADFERLTDEFGGGAAWHEFSDGKRPYPGLMQQWYLKGYGKETGWLGSGVDRGRYFLVFRAAPPAPLTKVENPLALLPSVAAFLDTSSQWLKAACKEPDWETPSGKPAKASKSGKPVCYRSGEDSRLWIRIVRRAPLHLQVRLEEGESPALRDIRRVVQTVPDASQAEYAKDLSQMLLSEAQIFLAKLGQRLPGLFNWPSWQVQGSKEGQVPAERYLELVRSEMPPEDHLPALRLEARNIRLAINLYYKGAFHMEAEERQ